MRKKSEPIHYQIRRAIMADPALTSTAKLVADVATRRSKASTAAIREIIISAERFHAGAALELPGKAG